MDEELEEIEDALSEDEELSEEEGDVEPESGEEPLSDEGGDEESALEPDDDVYAEVEYEKDGELYRYEVPKDVADAIRAAERERLGSRQQQRQVHPAVEKSQLRGVIDTWVQQGHTDTEIMKAVAEFYLNDSKGKQEEPDEPLPENATIEEEIEYRLAKQLKPLQKKVEEYENLLRRQQQAQAQEIIWEKNNALFEAELTARGLPLTINPKPGALLRSIIQEMTDNAPLDQYQLNRRQVKAIFDQFAEEMMLDDDEDEPTHYAGARVAYRGRTERPQRPQQVRAQTPQKKAPQILSGRTVRKASFKSQEPEKPKTPRDSMELLRSL